jgi:hypothetical protein
MDPESEEKVAAIWSSALAERPLCDNIVLGVARYDEHQIEAFPLPYRYVLAQLMRPDLFARPFKALAVSGITLCEGRLVLGRRAEWVTQDPGMLELVPSGSIDADAVGDAGEILAARQLGLELAEELGVGLPARPQPQILGLVEDTDNRVVDLVLRSHLPCTFDELIQAHAKLDRPEYRELIAVTPGELRSMIDDGREAISAVSIAIFTRFCVPEQES